MFFSLRNRLLLIFTCLLTIPFVILSIIIPSFFTSVIREQTQELTIEMMDQFSLYVDSVTTQAEDLGKQVLVSQTTQEWIRLNRQGAEKEEIDSLMNQLKQDLSSIMINNSNAMSISVLLEDGTGTWGVHPSLHETDWYQDFTQHNQAYVKSHLDPFQQSHEMQQKKINSYILPLIDTNTMISAGVIKVNFPSALLETALNKITIGQNEHTYLLNQRGENILSGKIETPNSILKQSLKQITTSDDKEGLIEAAYQKEKYLVFFQKLPVGDWILVSEVTESDLFARANHLQRNLLITSAVLFFITIVASLILSNNITSPLGKLAKAMRFIERGDFSGAKRFMPHYKSQSNEVDYLINVTEHTIDQLQNLIETEYEANLRRKDAEYKALLLQINPHFLNNTLEIIGSLALQGKNKEVMNVSVYLGKMLRYSLNTKSNIVSLGEEVNYIKSYTNILKLRYEDTIAIQMDVEPETVTIPVIKFILQPLVENAVKYSFSEKTFADIFIKTEVVGSQLCLSVADKGMGMSEELISDLLSTADETLNVLESKGNSIGLRNVLGRLKLTYGDDFSYRIESTINEGTKIILLIDLKRGGRQDEGINHR
ncbi:two-component system sensor histidine kinase YesM [Neobacillus niacini]|uniref:cache domain-containing sensor histidine kinase n=1 Tax=Neobacillus driksii TaxID=3035913 RepID=UPI00278AA4E4|nr:sensor histidine kinase [Neobacillus niacini]MDQ0974956.1 two-component system sensor histidine kinase YesM [Neobacillus niacini]